MQGCWSPELSKVANWIAQDALGYPGHRETASRRHADLELLITAHPTATMLPNKIPSPIHSGLLNVQVNEYSLRSLQKVDLEEKEAPPGHTMYGSSMNPYTIVPGY
ncbi:hypothetical protein I7I51_02109 [Histoplasma capsulatum]|uniref:Uncharacterized protein n=1 Tax=Ajellomyces capsulatus TaxID=5037 RepID=A0A8A1MGD4_AJECA|nr:hypothetical protein I7I51_02109 [Histoplasma capsulatum]